MCNSIMWKTLTFIADKRKPNTPLQEFVKQTPFIIVAVAFFVCAACTVCFIAYIVKQGTTKVKDHVQPDNAIKRDYKKLHNVEKRASNKYMFVNGEGVEMIVTQEPSTESEAEGQVRVVPDDSESRAKPPTGSSLTAAKFIAEKLYIGLKHNQYGGWFHEMIQNVIQKAKEPASTHDVQSDGLPNTNGHTLTSQF